MIVYYTSPLASLNYVGKDTVNDQVYNFISSDAYSFQYDAQRRLINHVLVRTGASDYGVYQHQNQYTYVYDTARMRETQTNEGGTQSYSFWLDSTQSRVLNYTKRMYADYDPLYKPVPTTLDTLRQYSSDGILKSVVRASTRQAITIDKRNISRIDEYSTSTGNLESYTTFAYDMDHYAPPAHSTFLGETSLHAIIRQTGNYILQEKVSTYVSIYQNEYDDKRRIVKQIEFSQSPGQTNPTLSTVTRYYY